jgi:S1-C subfamily serine protease
MSEMRPVVLALVLCLFPAGALAQPRSIQETALLTRPAVVLVVVEMTAHVRLDCGSGRETDVTPLPSRQTGTGWFVAADGWVVTNASTVDIALRSHGWLRDQQVERAVHATCVPAELAASGTESANPRLLEETTRRLVAAVGRRARVTLERRVIVVMANGARLAATVAKPVPPVTDAQLTTYDLALLKVTIADAPVLPLRDSAGLKLGDVVHVVGHPEVVLTHELLDRSARQEATVTSGAVSGFQQDRAGNRLIQTDAPGWSSSGGPAVDHRGRVVGVLAFVGTAGADAGEFVQGFNFLVPMSAVRDFLAGTPVDLRMPSRFNTAWRGGLDAFFGGRHPEAALRFAEAERLLPGLPDVARITEENERLRQTMTTRRLAWVAGALIVGVTGAIAVASVVMGRRARNRFRIRPAAVALLLESGAPPLIIDARDDTTYVRSPVRLPTAVHISPTDLEAGLSSLPLEPGRAVVAYCS